MVRWKSPGYDSQGKEDEQVNKRERSTKVAWEQHLGVLCAAKIPLNKIRMNEMICLNQSTPEGFVVLDLNSCDKKSTWKPLS